MKPRSPVVLSETYSNWADAWGLSLAFAVTQSLERSEAIIADSIAALIASDTTFSRAENSPLPSINAVRFAATIWDLAHREAWKASATGVTDPFFKMLPVGRAIVVLKVRARLARHQIAAALHLKSHEVDAHLENARLLFSSGRSWLGMTPGVSASCTQVWQLGSEDPSLHFTQPMANTEVVSDRVFAHYVGQDMDSATSQKLFAHITDCSDCRSSLAHFKQRYSRWIESIPVLEADEKLRKHWQKVTQMALQVNRRSATPSVLPGIVRVAADKQLRLALLLGAASLIIVKLLSFRQLH